MNLVFSIPVSLKNCWYVEKVNSSDAEEKILVTLKYKYNLESSLSCVFYLWKSHCFFFYFYQSQVTIASSSFFSHHDSCIFHLWPQIYVRNLFRADNHSSFPSFAKISRKMIRGHSKYLDKFVLSGLNYTVHQTHSKWISLSILAKRPPNNVSK